MFVDPYRDLDEAESTLTNHLATLGWYLVFILTIPLLIRYFYGFDYLKYYFPVVDLIANIFGASGSHDRVFKDLYKLSPNNLISYLSTNFINLLALVGVAWNAIHHAMRTKDLWLGIEVAVVMYIVTYLLPTQGIPIFVRKFQEYIDRSLGIKYSDDRVNWEGYIGGFVVMILLITLEAILIKMYITSLY